MNTCIIISLFETFFKINTALNTNYLLSHLTGEARGTRLPAINGVVSYLLLIFLLHAGDKWFCGQSVKERLIRLY